MIHFDTSFVVDFLREASRGEEGPATTLLTSLPEEELAISIFVLCEFLAGAALAHKSDEERQKIRRFCATLRITYPDRRSRMTMEGSSARSGAPVVTRGQWIFSSRPPPCAPAPAWSPATARTFSVWPASTSSHTEGVPLPPLRKTASPASTAI